MLLGFPVFSIFDPPPDWIDENLRVSYDNEGRVQGLSSTFEFVIEIPGTVVC
jgi:hypothetical protein